MFSTAPTTPVDALFTVVSWVSILASKQIDDMNCLKPVYTRYVSTIPVGVESEQFLPISQTRKGSLSFRKWEGGAYVYVCVEDQWPSTSRSGCVPPEIFVLIWPQCCTQFFMAYPVLRILAIVYTLCSISEPVCTR